MPRTTTVEDDLANAIATAIDGMTGIVAEEVYRYPRARLGGEIPAAYVMLSGSELLSRADDEAHWRVDVAVILVSRPEVIAQFKAWVMNAFEDDETLGSKGYRVQANSWEFGYPVGSGEGDYAWCETTVSAKVMGIVRGKNIESV